jgi:hypothetical protein
MTVKYDPKPGFMTPGYKVGETIDVTEEYGSSLLSTGNFVEVKPEPKAKPKRLDSTDDGGDAGEDDN